MNRWIRDNLKTQYIHIQLSDEKEQTLNVSKYIEIPIQDGYGKEDHWVREYIQDKLDDFCSKISEEVDNIMKELVEWVDQVMMEELQ
tara:strand:+ start:843 stop:1103 length:261 start_codon:yes stop_codon:yes gene_type:complete